MTQQMTIQNKLFLFLYDHIKSGKFVTVNHIFTDCGLDTFEIRNTINQLDNIGLIEVTDDYKLLGKVGHRKPYTIIDILIKARLTAKGQIHAEHILSTNTKSNSK